MFTVFVFSAVLMTSTLIDTHSEFPVKDKFLSIWNFFLGHWTVTLTLLLTHTLTLKKLSADPNWRPFALWSLKAAGFHQSLEKTLRWSHLSQSGWGQKNLKCHFRNARWNQGTCVKEEWRIFSVLKTVSSHVCFAEASFTSVRHRPCPS